MNISIRTALPAALAVALVCPYATPALQKQGKKGKKAAAASAAADPGASVSAGPAAAAPVAPSSSAPPAGTQRETAAAENDPARTAWRLDVKPFAVLGSGHPGKADADFDKPDGVAFTPNGLLLATDAKNRRVQVWDVRTGTRLGEFGHKFFGGEIVDIAVAPSGMVLVTDQTLNLAYAFTPPTPGEVDKETGKTLGPTDYKFKGTKFGEQGFDKLGGIAIDSRNRIYCVDAHLNEVRRFNQDFTPDPSWHFDKGRAGGGDTYLHGCEGIAIDEGNHSLFVSSEKDAVVQVFDSETGAYKHALVGASADTSGAPSGKHVFFASVEGLSIAQNHLFAVDEAAGHIQIFDLSRPGAFNTDLVKFATPKVNRTSGYRGFVGHSPLVDFEDKTNLALQQQVKSEAIIPGQANPPGYFCSPDSITTYTDNATGETYVAIADQCNYRLAIYKWSDISRTFKGGGGGGPAGGGPGGKGGKKGKKAL